MLNRFLRACAGLLEGLGRDIDQTIRLVRLTRAQPQIVYTVRMPRGAALHWHVGVTSGDRLWPRLVFVSREGAWEVHGRDWWMCLGQPFGVASSEGYRYTVDLEDVPWAADFVEAVIRPDCARAVAEFDRLRAQHEG